MAKSKATEWLTDDGLLRLSAWARDGLTDEQIASNMGIAIRTLYVWKEKHVQIVHALKTSKALADIAVENALYKRALGYEYEETTKEANGAGEPTKLKSIRKHVPPDVAAMIIWLKNRKPDTWRDNPEARRPQHDDGFMSAFSKRAAADWSAPDDAQEGWVDQPDEPDKE